MISTVGMTVTSQNQLDCWLERGECFGTKDRPSCVQAIPRCHGIDIVLPTYYNLYHQTQQRSLAARSCWSYCNHTTNPR